MLRDANQRLEVTNEALRIENLERKRAEKALRESEAKFRDFAETASDWLLRNRSGLQIHDAERECHWFRRG